MIVSTFKSTTREKNDHWIKKTGLLGKEIYLFSVKKIFVKNYTIIKILYYTYNQKHNCEMKIILQIQFIRTRDNFNVGLNNGPIRV